MGEKLKQSYEIDYTFKINELLRHDSWCFCYNVYWKDKLYLDSPTWRFKSFGNKRDAKNFAKKMWKENKETKLKPYILEKIVPCTIFKKELFLTLTIVNPDKYGYNYVRRIS